MDTTCKNCVNYLMSGETDKLASNCTDVEWWLVMDDRTITKYL